ncbi:uncharacterized protein LOC114239441 [Bombyx mandarina]|uniref:Uncharacterized protein LOC114239441 n=1 Tax=Bombyx mandarina TaxID=7092 RepID=A0A6J2JA44_BOMMA|nr:uncharacterized protein LOC114239441 [Bombyx mandarina]
MTDVVCVKISAQPRYSIHWKRSPVSRKNLASHVKVSLGSIGTPLPITSERFIGKTIERVWKLTDAFMYTLKYLGGSQDECSQFYYFEAIFSQPCTAYPIPQATVSVFFRIEDKHIEPLEIRGVPRMWFRIEGQQVDHDVQFVALTADWILAVLQMKMKLFQRIEKIQLF